MGFPPANSASKFVPKVHFSSVLALLVFYEKGTCLGVSRIIFQRFYPSTSPLLPPIPTPLKESASTFLYLPPTEWLPQRPLRISWPSSWNQLLGNAGSWCTTTEWMRKVKDSVRGHRWLRAHHKGDKCCNHISQDQISWCLLWTGFIMSICVLIQLVNSVSPGQVIIDLSGC